MKLQYQRMINKLKMSTKEREIQAEYDHVKYEKYSKQANQLGVDIEDVVWIIGCDDLEMIKRHLTIFSLLPRCVRFKVVSYMSKNNVSFNFGAFN